MDLNQKHVQVDSELTQVAAAADDITGGMLTGHCEL